MKMLEILGGSGLVVVLCVGVYFLVMRLSIRPEPPASNEPPRKEPNE